MHFWRFWEADQQLLSFLLQEDVFKNDGKSMGFHLFLPMNKVKTFVSLYLASKMQTFHSQSRFANPNQADSRFIDVMSYTLTRLYAKE